MTCPPERAKRMAWDNGAGLFGVKEGGVARGPLRMRENRWTGLLVR